MVQEKMLYCWDIMQCDDAASCPVRQNNIEKCWEWMRNNNQFQFQYDLCNECIVYLYNNQTTQLSKSELEQAMLQRGLYEKGIYRSGPHNLR